MEEVANTKGDASPRNSTSSSSANASGGVTTAAASSSSSSSPSSSAAPAARSVISISRDNVTITSTGKDGGSRQPPKFATTPLRSNQEPSMTGKGHVSDKVRDTQFVTALSQRFQTNGPLTVPAPGPCAARSAPASISTSSRASASHSRSSSSSGGSGGLNEDLTAKLSQMLLAQQQQQQQQQQVQQQRQSQRTGGRERQQGEVNTSGSVSPAPAAAPVMVNGGTTPDGSSGRGSNSGASSPEIPPPPPPSALVRSVSEQPAALRKVPDASYTPRPKSYSTQNSETPGNGSGIPPHNKHDLMASLTAVVTSGSPVAGLRKTRGPGRTGGVTEVYTSKKTSGTSSTSKSAAASSSRKENN